MTLTGLFLAGCSIVPLAPEAQAVIVTWDTRDAINTCERRGTFVGSQGTWYNFWFISDHDLTIGAINQLRNQSSQAGANTLSLYNPPVFSTSVTLIGNAYLCPEQ